MSLINEALKKAQKQRTGEAPPLASLPAIGGEAPARIAGRTKSAPLTALLVRLGGGVAALAVVIVAALFLFRDKPAATAATPPPAVAATAPVAPPDVPATAPRATGNTFVLPIAPPPEPVTAKPEPAAASVAPVPAPEPEKPAPDRAAAPPPRLEPRATTFIENIRVAGIRASGTDSKVLMNDRVYRIGDLVEHELGLRLVGITSSSLTFEDERGGRYTRNF